MSGAERTTRSRRPPLAFGTIVVVGGGCYGSYYVRQLGRAAVAGAATWERLIVVDRDPGCAIASSRRGQDRVSFELDTRTWEAFFEEYLGAAGSDPGSAGRDAIVPSPLMPHLLYDWLLVRARSRWPGRQVGPGTIGGPFPVPWQRDAATQDTRYVSFAEWMCPINCIEPARCPVTRGARTWSLPPAIQHHVDALRAAGRPVLGPHLFHCVHRCYGVGMIDVSSVLAADEAIATAAAISPAEVLVGTVSHCHGALSVIAIGA